MCVRTALFSMWQTILQLKLQPLECARSAGSVRGRTPFWSHLDVGVQVLALPSLMVCPGSRLYLCEELWHIVSAFAHRS
jgi:hypothetical protein